MSILGQGLIATLLSPRSIQYQPVWIGCWQEYQKFWTVLLSYSRCSSCYIFHWLSLICWGPVHSRVILGVIYWFLKTDITDEPRKFKWFSFPCSFSLFSELKNRTEKKKTGLLTAASCDWLYFAVFLSQVERKVGNPPFLSSLSPPLAPPYIPPTLAPA